MNRIASFLTMACLVATSAVSGQTRPAANEPPSVTPKQQPTGDFIGQDQCASCHRAEAIQYAKTPHAFLGNAGCETCHGSGQRHAEAEGAAAGDDAKAAAAAKLIFSFKGNPKQNAERCMGCHESSREQRNFDHSPHMQHGVDCSSCHSSHLVGAARSPNRKEVGSAQANLFTVPQLGAERGWLASSLLKKPQPDLCYRCHGNIQAQFALPTHHRVPEGAMKCTDCHNTHGTSNRATLRQSGWDTCASCHVEKRGPFVFEHSAVKVEGCVACHTPHGSVNKQLLVRKESRFLCLQCHVNPFAANVPHSRLSFQSRGDCTRCHTTIHGSNFDVNFLH